MKPISDSTAIELSFAPEWTVFGPCGETDPAPVFADLAACPATLRLEGKELTARKVGVLLRRRPRFHLRKRRNNHEP